MTYPAPKTPIIGCYCPMGCGETLYASAGTLNCSNEDCPRPTAADEILSDPETEHIVELTNYDFSMQHPLRERLEGELFDCPLARLLRSSSRPPASPGRYRARIDNELNSWVWEPL